MHYHSCYCHFCHAVRFSKQPGITSFFPFSSANAVASLCSRSTQKHMLAHIKYSYPVYTSTHSKPSQAMLAQHSSLRLHETLCRSEPTLLIGVSLINLCSLLEIDIACICSCLQWTEVKLLMFLKMHRTYTRHCTNHRRRRSIAKRLLQQQSSKDLFLAHLGCSTIE